MKKIEILCKKCQEILAISWDNQYLAIGNVEIWHTLRGSCANCNKPFYWNATDEHLEAIGESPKDISRKILLELASSNKGVKKIN
jgi:hypothetical protein